MDDRALQDLLFIAASYCQRKINEIDQELMRTQVIPISELQRRQHYLKLVDVIESANPNYAMVRGQESGFLDDLEGIYDAR